MFRRLPILSFVLAGVLAAQERAQESHERPATPAPKNAVPAEQRRAVAQDAARFEANYRSTVGRLNRLISVYEAKGDQEKVMQLERMRERLAVRREHALEGFRRDLGEDGFQRVQGQLQGGGRRALEERARKARPPGDTGGR